MSAKRDRCSIQRSHEYFYLASYPDVQAAIGRGEFSSGLDHYKKHGMSEGRHFEYTGSSEDFDEVFYLMTYPDAAMAVSKGEFKSGAEHFVKIGSKRGYGPNPSGGGKFTEGALAEAFEKQQQPEDILKSPTRNQRMPLMRFFLHRCRNQIESSSGLAQSIASTAKYNVLK